MKLINLPLAVCVSLCLFVSCENMSKKNLDIAIDSKQEEVKAPMPLDEAKEIASNSDFNRSDSTASPQPQQPQKPEVKNNPQPRIDWDKKIIKTASLNAEVHNYDSFYSSLRDRVRSIGGYVAQEEQNQSDYKIENTITIKVPVDQFDNAVSLMTAGTQKVNDRKITSQDVTTEVVDIKSRMEAKKEVRLRYIDLLKQAKNMTDILSVQSEINGIQEEIESAAGRISYLSHSSAFSTINFTFYQVLNISAIDYKEPSFGTKLITSFKAGWQWMSELFVELVSIWPILLFIIFIWTIIKRFVRSKAKPVSATE